MDTARLTAGLKEEALRLGFDLAGATPAAPPPDLERFRQWLDAGRAGQMHYLADRIEAYRDPRALLDGARSILMLGLNYRTVEPAEPGPGQARVSRYAWGGDYHEVIKERLHALGDWHRREIPGGNCRGVVDTAPLFEKRFGQLAGLGRIGKNRLLIHPNFGSWFFLAAFLTTEELVYDAPMEGDPCGTCRSCLDACPTGAITEAGGLDARKCLSYRLIELRSPAEDEPPLANDRWLFGCDACQEACPWNRDTPSTSEAVFRPRSGMNPVELSEIIGMNDESFRQRFRHTPLWRTRREGIVRNALCRDGGRETRDAGCGHDLRPTVAAQPSPPS